MVQEAAAVQAAFQVGDEVLIVGEEARRACGAESGTVVGHCVPASDSEEPIVVIVAPDNAAPVNARLAPTDLKRAT